MTYEKMDAAVLRALADGEPVQLRARHDAEPWFDMLRTERVLDFKAYEYRVKPPMPKYRVALFRTGSITWTNTTDNAEDAASSERTLYFVRWLTDWQEYQP